MSPYQAEDIRLKLLWTTGKWKHPEASRSDYHRLAFVDELASSLAVNAWLDGRLTWRKLWRIVSENPGEFEEQQKKLT